MAAQEDRQQAAQQKAATSGMENMAVAPEAKPVLLNA
jgi:hypothetical protein